MKTLQFLALLPFFLFASCASEKGESAATAPARKSMMQRMNEDNGYKKSASGEWVPQNNQRSQFESKGESAYFKKDFKKQEYQTGDYAKKSWWGGKEYDRKSFAGNTDGSRFEKSSRLQGKGARETGNLMASPDNYQTNSFATSNAREAATAKIATPSGAQYQVDQRQKVFQQPEIVDWREQRSLSIGQSKGILGR